jgi:polysaccharide biosynthesis/export protein
VRNLSIHIELLIVLSLLTLHCNAQSKPETITPNSNPSASMSNTAEAKSQAASGFQERHPRYQLRPDDTLDVVFEFSPEFNQTVTVQPDGYVALKGVGDVQVAGLTIPQLNDVLRKEYGKFLHDPSVAVVLKNFERPYFVASGRVARPGRYDLRGDTTVSQAIAVAGGFLDSAKNSQVVLFRRVSEGWAETQLLDMKKMLNSRNLAEDLHLRPGDMIFVPQNRLSKIERFLPIPKTSGNVMLNPSQY